MGHGSIHLSFFPCSPNSFLLRFGIYSCACFKVLPCCLDIGQGVYKGQQGYCWTKWKERSSSLAKIRKMAEGMWSRGSVSPDPFRLAFLLNRHVLCLLC